MQLLSVGIEMPDGKVICVDLEVGEAVGRFAEWAALAFGNLAFADAGSAAAGENERGLQGFEFEMLQVVIVAAEVERDSVFLQQRAEVINQGSRVAVLAVAVDGMMADADGPAGAGLLEFRFQPLPLGRSFVRGEGVAGDGRHVGVQEKEGHLGIVFSIPFGRHGPAGPGFAGVGHLHILPALVVAVVVVSEHGRAGAGEEANGIHLLEAGLPARRIHTAFHLLVKVVAEEEQAIRLQAGLVDVACHAAGHGKLGRTLAAEVADGQPMGGGRRNGEGLGRAGGTDIQAKQGTRAKKRAEDAAARPQSRLVVQGGR